MANDFFDVSKIKLGRDGQVELDDAELSALELNAKFAVGGGVNIDDCDINPQPNTECFGNNPVTCDNMTNSDLTCMNPGSCKDSTNLFACSNSAACDRDNNQNCTNGSTANCSRTNSVCN